MHRAYGCKYRPTGNAHSLFQSQDRCSCAMWPCSDITSSDDDEHNTDSNFLLLFADIGIMPTLLEGLTDVDVLHKALGCRFALDMFTISNRHSLHLITSHFLTTLSSPHSEHWLHTSATFITPANWLGPCSFQFSSIMCALDCDDNLTHTLSLREAGTCATRS